jgi:hypothetical protein
MFILNFVQIGTFVHRLKGRHTQAYSMVVSQAYIFKVGKWAQNRNGMQHTRGNKICVQNLGVRLFR